MGAVALWSFVGAGSLIVGALIAFWFDVSERMLGLIMGFGAGTLLSAISFDLLLPSYASAGTLSIVLGFLAGALTFWAGDRALSRRSGGADPAAGQGGSGPALVLGAFLDGVPESVAIGLTMLGGSPVSVAVVVAVFLSNIPEGLAATMSLSRGGMSRSRILLMWIIITVICVLAAVLGYTLLAGASPGLVSFIQTFAAGAILTMLANTMMPEAYAHGGREVGLVTVLGFLLASGLATHGG